MPSTSTRRRLRSRAPVRLLAAGFTLLELMVVVGVVAVLAAVAIPNFTNMYYSVNSQSLAEELYNLANVAHTTAIRTGVVHILRVEGSNRQAAVLSDGNANGAPDGNDSVVRGIDFPGGIVVGPATGYDAAPLPAPYGFIVPSTGCSFCGGGVDGYLLFTSTGRVLDDGGQPVTGAWISVIPERDAINNVLGRMRLLTIVGLTGDIRLWRK